MRQPEGDRVSTRRTGHFVHEGLQRKGVGIGPQGAQGRGADGHVQQQVVDGFVLAEVVQRYGIAVAAARWLRDVARGAGFVRLLQQPGRAQVDAIGVKGAGAVGVAPQLVLPVHHLARSVQRAAHLHHHGRAQGLGRELILTHPLQAHRHAGQGARQQGGVQRHVVSAVVAVAARALFVADGDVLLRHAQGLGHVVAQREHALRMAPHAQLVFGFVGAPLRNGARRADRGMGLVGAGVFSADLDGGGGGCGGAFFVGHY